ncbi:MAG: hypothetical protein HZY73_13515 [Micropruina sp.]|nr:MAG: hypothetical protein HZY73_13515 [Micropruina sp.]
MELLHNLVVLVHFLGFAALLGGALAQLRSEQPVVNSMMRDGAWTQLVTGIILVVFKEFGTEPVNHVKIGIKLLVLVAVLFLILINRKKDFLDRGAFFGILGLTVLNAAVAVLWE